MLSLLFFRGGGGIAVQTILVQSGAGEHWWTYLEAIREKRNIERRLQAEQNTLKQVKTQVRKVERQIKKLEEPPQGILNRLIELSLKADEVKIRLIDIEAQLAQIQHVIDSFKSQDDEDDDDVLLLM